MARKPNQPGAQWQNRIVDSGIEDAGQLLANPFNARIHPQFQQQALEGVLDSVGWVQRVIVNKTTGHVVDGHLRIALAITRNEQVPVDYVELTEAEEKLILASFDYITTMAVYDREQLDTLLQDVNSDDARVQDLLAKLAEDNHLYQNNNKGEDKGAQVDRAEELQQVWNVERGQVWAIGEHRLMCGDSTNADDVALVMTSDRAELVWTDPPYGVSVGDKNKMLNAIARSNRVEENLTNDTLDEPELFEMLRRAFGNACEFCKPGAAWYVAAPPGPLHVLFGMALKERDIWRQTIQWVKNNATFAPLGVDYHWRSEPIFYGWMPNAAHRYYGGRKQDTVWEFDRPQKSPEHPTMKPVELIARAVENSSQIGDITYDPFGGSGTTMVACQQLGRKCRMMEIEPKYCAVILQRMSDMGLTPRLVT